MTKIKVRYNVTERKDHITTFLVTDKQKEWIEKTAKELNTTKSAVISQLINKEIENGSDK